MKENNIVYTKKEFVYVTSLDIYKQFLDFNLR